MIVVDASALLEFLLQTSIGVQVEARLFRDGDELHAPHVVDVEVVQGLRRLVRMGEVSSGRADEAIVDLADLDLHRHPQSIYWVGRGSYATTSVHTMPGTWPSQKRSTPPSSRAAGRWRRRPDAALESK